MAPSLASRVASRWLTAGADTFTTYAVGASAQDAFRRATQDALREHGHRGGYSGTIASKKGFRLRSTRPMTRDEARAFADRDLDNNDKYDAAFAVPVSGEAGGGVVGYLFYGWAPT